MNTLNTIVSELNKHITFLSFFILTKENVQHWKNVKNYNL